LGRHATQPPSDEEPEQPEYHKPQAPPPLEPDDDSMAGGRRESIWESVRLRRRDTL
jgi:hypothetical protein